MGDEDIMSKKKRRILIIAVTLAVLVAASVALYIYIDKEKRVYKECSVEAGTPVSASDFVRFKRDKKSAAFQYGTSAYAGACRGAEDDDVRPDDPGRRLYRYDG